MKLKIRLKFFITFSEQGVLKSSTFNIDLIGVLNRVLICQGSKRFSVGSSITFGDHQVTFCHGRIRGSLIYFLPNGIK